MIDDTEQTPLTDATHEPTTYPEQPMAVAADVQVSTEQANAPSSADPASAGSHPAHALLSRIEAEVDGMLHSPLALANWVKSMVAEARKLL